MSEIINMRRLLRNEGDPSSPLSPEDENALLTGHTEAISYEFARDLQALETALQAVQARLEALDQERTGGAVLRTLRSVGRLSSDPASYDRIVAVLADCTQLDPPRFAIQSAEEIARNSAGNVLRFTRANASARTLEVAAATGEFGGLRWPASETFIFGFNRSEASIGGVLTIPAHGEGAVLTVSMQLGVEYLLLGGIVSAGTASSLLYAVPGDGNLPLRGTALGWGIAGLSLHGATGSARTALKFVSEWVNRDGAENVDRAPGGIIRLIKTVALRPETSRLSVFVDMNVFAGAEESEELLPAFTVFECRNKPVQEITGIYVPPSRLRLREVTAHLCELPVLLQDGLTIGSPDEEQASYNRERK